MENEVYEKDYGEEFREWRDQAKGKDFLDTMNGTKAIFLKPGMSAVFQASGNHRKPVPCFQGILPYTPGSLVIQQGVMDVINITVEL